MAVRIRAEQGPLVRLFAAVVSRTCGIAVRLVIGAAAAEVVIALVVVAGSLIEDNLEAGQGS
jgi:hypothetical protein